MPPERPNPLSEIAIDARLLFDSAVGLVRRAIASPATPQVVWLSSFVALGAVDAASVCRLSPAAARAVAAAGLAGGTVMLVTSVTDLDRSRDLHARMDAVGDLTWAGQALLYLGSSAATQAAALALGVLGASVQTTVGALRIRQGLRDGEMALVKLGLLDLGGGLLWLGWDLIGWSQPLFIGTYVVLMIAREAYATSAGLSAFASRLGAQARGAVAEIGRDLRGARSEAEELLGVFERLALPSALAR